MDDGSSYEGRGTEPPADPSHLTRREVAVAGEAAGLPLGEHRRRLRRHRKSPLVRFLTHKVTVSIIIVLILVLGSGVTALAVYTRDTGVFMPGLSVAGINVGNMTQAAGQARVNQKIAGIRSRAVKFEVEGKTLKSTLGDLGLTLTVDKALTEAYQVGRQGNLIEKAEQKKAASQGMSFNMNTAWDKKKLSEALTKMFAPFDVAPHDASFTITPQNTMKITPDSAGKAVDITALAKQVQKLDTSLPSNTLKVSFTKEPPKLTAATLAKEKITGLLGSYTSYFDSSQVGRTKNVGLAAAAINGTVVAPGAVFSFNKTVGECTAAKGYVNAYIIVNGQFVEGRGGGVCQVSSTLYNAVLYSDLHVTQRTNHDLVISYMPLGQDATVAWPGPDVQFENDSGGYVLIRTKMGTNSLTINFYGQAQPGRKVLIQDYPTPVPPPVQTVKDPSLPAGQKQVKQQGVQGYKVTTTRTVVQNGKTVSTENLPSSYYAPTPTIIAVGPDK
ncbi:vancomycin B-type resistance protein VanW [Peptococcaceae bacterium CEB3]|nr:vancomycin B-type resistance protein VanW [Peptococcaceae bacterium CEB3]